MTTNEPETASGNTCSISSATQWLPSNDSTENKCVRETTTDGAPRRRHGSYPVDGKKTIKPDHEFVSLIGERALADGRNGIVEDDVTQLIALEDVDIPTDSEEDDELDKVQVNSTMTFHDFDCKGSIYVGRPTIAHEGHARSLKFSWVNFG